jgi:hypothetical protein
MNRGRRALMFRHGRPVPPGAPAWLRVACPYCKVQPGWHCVTRGDVAMVYGAHAKRVTAAALHSVGAMDGRGLL